MLFIEDGPKGSETSGINAIKVYRGRKSIAPFILNLGVVSLKPRPLYLWEGTP
jgi:hypothetical protein